MSFLERFAKLKSNVNSSGDSFVVSVYDDELETNNAIMWLEAYMYDVDSPDLSSEIIETMKENGIDDILHVDIVNFNDEIYFELPQNRQNNCASVLLRKFISYYKENYDEVPVRATFANYSIQEKFKTAIEKGIFPKESLLLSEFVDEETWKNDNYYNKDNREKKYNLKKVIPQYVSEQGVNLDNENLITNEPVTQTFSICESVINNLNEEFDGEVELSKMIFARINGIDIKYGIPIKNLGKIDNYDLSYTFNEGVLSVGSNVNFVRENEELIRTVFDNIQSIFTTISGNNGGLRSVDEFYSEQVVTSSNKRLIPKGITKI